MSAWRGTTDETERVMTGRWTAMRRPAVVHSSTYYQNETFLRHGWTTFVLLRKKKNRKPLFTGNGTYNSDVSNDVSHVLTNFVTKL
jgi:hypothetical protein